MRLALEDQLAHAARLQNDGHTADADAVYRDVAGDILDRARQEPTAAWAIIAGEVLLRLDRTDDAMAALSEAVTLHPNRAEVHGAIGHVHERLGDWAAAEVAYTRALALDPALAEARCNLGHVLCRQARWPAAMLELQTALQINPALPAAHYHLAVARRAMGRSSQAAESLRQAVALQPSFAAAWQLLGDVLLDTRDRKEAVDAYRRAAEIDSSAMNRLNLGAALSAVDECDAALQQIGLAVAAEPAWSDAHKGLGQALYGAGDLDAAIVAFDRAVELDPANADADSHALYCRLFRGIESPIELRDRALAWAGRHTAGITALPPAIVDPSPDRRLRVGYMSPNFRNHAVVLFVLPFLQQHDPWEVEVFGYSDTRSADAFTQRVKDACDEWRDTAGLSHEQLARVIRADKIDILVDLTGHIGDGRLQAMAYRAAPVQATYIGYQATTGVAGIDYVLTSAWADPVGMTESFWTETPWRLPEPGFAWQPPIEAPALSGLPLDRNGHVTFGCLNNPAKLTPVTFALWGCVIREVPDAKLIVLAPHSSAAHARIFSALAAHGVAADRIELLPRQSVQAYFDTYNRIDIALDPVPFNGHTTTCDAAWMGTPTVGVAGSCYAHRYGGAVMRQVGLPWLVADTAEAYVAAAARLAADRVTLMSLRTGLRLTMAGSPLMDGRRLAGQLEVVYRQMWKRWLAGPTART